MSITAWAGEFGGTARV